MPLICTKRTFIKAAMRGDLDSLEKHLEASFFSDDWYSNGGDGYSALFAAAENGHADAVEFLIGEGAGINLARSDNGETPLMAACKAGHKDVVKLLLRSGADVNLIMSCNGRNALHYAAEKGYLDIAQILISNGADLDVRNSQGNTPLHLAVSYNKVDTVDCLLQQGARTDIRNNKGKIPLGLIKDKTPQTIIKLLKQHMDLPAENIAKTKPAATATESWVKIGDDEVAHIKICPEIDRKNTEIFNFFSRQKMMISENLKSKAESQSPVESFDNIEEGLLQKAFEAFTKQKGVAEWDFVLRGTRKLLNKP